MPKRLALVPRSSEPEPSTPNPQFSHLPANLFDRKAVLLTDEERMRLIEKKDIAR